MVWWWVIRGVRGCRFIAAVAARLPEVAADIAAGAAMRCWGISWCYSGCSVKYAWDISTFEV